MSNKSLGFADVVLELQSWFGRPVDVAVSYTPHAMPVARLAGVLLRADEPSAESRRQVGELAKNYEAGAARSVLEDFARPPEHDVPVYMFIVGGESPDRPCWFSVNKAEVTDAHLSRDTSVEPATTTLTIHSGAQIVAVSSAGPPEE